MKTITITAWILRISALAALILGIIFWTGTEPLALRNIHMLLGIIVVISLWVLGTYQAAKGGSMSLALGAFILGLVLAIVGLYQVYWLPGDLHWIIRVIHLLLGLTAIGLGEMISGQTRRRLRGQVATV